MSVKQFVVASSRSDIHSAAGQTAHPTGHWASYPGIHKWNG